MTTKTYKVKKLWWEGNNLVIETENDETCIYTDAKIKKITHHYEKDIVTPEDLSFDIFPVDFDQVLEK